MLVNATDLDMWSATRDAEEDLPKLVRRLILATVPRIDELDFRAGEGVILPGWDGQVAVPDGTVMVPAVTSRWELSTSDQLPDKPQRDYKKRTEDPLGADPSQSTFVYATTRRWRDKDDWMERRRGEGKWKDVRVYDADSLETWLEQAPAVHIWLSRHLGKQPQDAMDLETYWEEWSGVTNPALTVPLVVAGRQSEAGQVLTWLADVPDLLSLKAETEAEAVAFLAAALQGLPDEDREKLFARAAIVKSEDAWRIVSFSPTGGVLVPQQPDRQSAPTAVGRGHHVFVPFARDHPLDQRTVELPPVDRQAAQAALVEMGLNDADAERLSSLAWRGLMILRRKIAISPALMTPPWARYPDCRRLLPAILAGSWDESRKADRSIVSMLGGRPYDEMRGDFLRVSAEPDAPLRRIGEKWFTVARADSWSLLSVHLTQQELARFKDAAVTVLREPDPKFGLPPEERHLAAVHGQVLAHSDDLREGMAETLGLLASYGGIEGATTGEEWAGWLVREVLDGADWILWASLSQQLSMLAEASPSEFMSAVERGLDGVESAIRSLFHQQVEGVFGSEPSLGLLSALEVLAWPTEHLRRASLLLARIHEAVDAR
jgi:hypothetical protein